jgi:hypothetical protein
MLDSARWPTRMLDSARAGAGTDLDLRHESGVRVDHGHELPQEGVLLLLGDSAGEPGGGVLGGARVLQDEGLERVGVAPVEQGAVRVPLLDRHEGGEACGDLGLRGVRQACGAQAGM